MATSLTSEIIYQSVVLDQIDRFVINMKNLFIKPFNHVGSTHKIKFKNLIKDYRGWKRISHY